MNVSLTIVSTMFVLLFRSVLTVWKTSMMFCCWIISLMLQMPQNVPDRPPPVLERKEKKREDVGVFFGGELEKQDAIIIVIIGRVRVNIHEQKKARKKQLNSTRQQLMGSSRVNSITCEINNWR